MEEKKSKIMQYMEYAKATAEIGYTVVSAIDGGKSAAEIQRAIEAKLNSGYEQVVTNPSGKTKTVDEKRTEDIKKRFDEQQETAEAYSTVKEKEREKVKAESEEDEALTKKQNEITDESKTLKVDKPENENQSKVQAQVNKEKSNSEQVISTEKAPQKTETIDNSQNKDGQRR